MKRTHSEGSDVTWTVFSLKLRAGRPRTVYRAEGGMVLVADVAGFAEALLDLHLDVADSSVLQYALVLQLKIG